jgi:microcompartment protein CcmL/EutN
MGCRSLDIGGLQGRRAHEALGVAAGDGCELLVSPGDVGAVAQALRAGYQSARITRTTMSGKVSPT